jgi:hypothetical protein
MKVPSTTHLRTFVASVAALCATACIAGSAPVATPEPLVVVPTPATTPAATPPDDGAVRTAADAASADLAQRLFDVETSCRERWLGSTVCNDPAFERIASAYQAYYSTHADVHEDDSRIDALPRLGGRGEPVADVESRITSACVERCRLARFESMSSAAKEAADACAARTTGYAACDAFAKHASIHLQSSDVEGWVDRCRGTCDGARASARFEAERERKRPRTKAQAVRCRAECDRVHGGGFCGTSLFACYSGCTPKGDAVVMP